MNTLKYWSTPIICSTSYPRCPNQSGNLHWCRPCQGLSRKRVDVWCIFLRCQSRECNARQSIRNRGLDLSVTCRLGRSVVDDVRLVDPADKEGRTSVRLVDLASVKAKRDWAAVDSLLPFDVGCERSDEREAGRGFARAWDDKGVGQVEGIGGRDTGIEWSRVRNKLEGFLAEEGVVAGFDSQNRCRALY